MNSLKKLDDLLEKGENWLIVLTGIAVCVIIFANAVMRHLLHTDFYGNEEITLFCAFWLYFTGSSVAAKKNTHINADMITMFTKNERTVDTFHLVRDVVSLGMAVAASIWSCQYVIWSGTMGAKSPVFKLPMLISQIPIMISFFLWTLYLIRDLARSINALKQAGEKPKEEG